LLQENKTARNAMPASRFISGERLWVSIYDGKFFEDVVKILRGKLKKRKWSLQRNIC